ncbi:hypothetical protein [Streptomyces sp. NBC_00199]|uniref:hypothetical protein n=1 Tax=Streptomyces sp. NBC_00199 TaxID=2975678 RepID=UPI002253BC4B|nr:hypothetical protein [Streptomyces sp. NBC_00199]MCX5269965.1 hypothetical protein [Streptomyces sp. NBC_00199]
MPFKRSAPEISQTPETRHEFGTGTGGTIRLTRWDFEASREALQDLTERNLRLERMLDGFDDQGDAVDRETLVPGVEWLNAITETAAQSAVLNRDVLRRIQADFAATAAADGSVMSPGELRFLAWESASTINHTLARLFVQLGPPPAGVGGDLEPLTSDGGGAQQ